MKVYSKATAVHELWATFPAFVDMKNTPDLYERLSTLPRNLSGSLARSALRGFAQIHTIILMC